MEDQGSGSRPSGSVFFASSLQRVHSMGSTSGPASNRPIGGFRTVPLILLPASVMGAVPGGLRNTAAQLPMQQGLHTGMKNVHFVN